MVIVIISFGFGCFCSGFSFLINLLPPKYPLSFKEAKFIFKLTMGIGMIIFSIAAIYGVSTRKETSHKGATQ